jgi:hypothetical protein
VNQPSDEHVYPQWLTELLRESRTLEFRAAISSGGAQIEHFLPKDVVEAFIAQVNTPAATKPTLPEWFLKLPCKQQLVVYAVILLVLLSFDLPPEIRDYIAGQLAIIGAALAVIHKITKS